MILLFSFLPFVPQSAMELIGLWFQVLLRTVPTNEGVLHVQHQMVRFAVCNRQTR
jgi:hypothetical protein